METLADPKINFAAPTTAGELLGVKSPDPDFDLAANPLHIGRIESEDPSPKFIAIFDRPLLGYSFLRFLTLTAPYPAFAGDYQGVLNDWYLYDQGGDDAKERQQRHDQLGPHMEAFKKYRPSMMNNLNSQSGNRWSKSNPTPLTRVALINHNIRGLEREVTLNAAGRNLSYPDAFTDLFVDFLKGDKYKKLDYYFPGWSNNSIITMFGFRGATGDLLQVHDIWNEFVIDLTADQKDKIALEVEKFEFQGLISGSKTHRGLGIVEPVVSWESSDDTDRKKAKRDVDCFPLPKVFTAQLDQYLKADGSGIADFYHYNGLAGLLAIKYLLPEIGAAWKERLSLPGNPHNKNVMAEQAVLVLGSMMRGSVLASEFFPKAEQYHKANS
jgi:hypothetical protein